MKSNLVFLMLFILTGNVFSQNIPPLWTEYEELRRFGSGSATLPDFSYAGYHFSEKEIPSLSERAVFDVTDYGAVPDDAEFDDVAIKKAISAALATKDGGIVFFPPGKFLIAPDEDRDSYFLINQSNILLKGSGSGVGGTEIHQVNMRIGSRQFRFEPKENKTEKLAVANGTVQRESFIIEVVDASKLRVGQDVILTHKSEEYTKNYFAPRELSAAWDRLFGSTGGMQIKEIHTIEEINGTTVRFKNPLHIDVIPVEGYDFELNSYNSIEECGIEDILFSGSWDSYPEEFVHHKDGIHDGGWVAIHMGNAKNSWIRNCAFTNLNEVINIRNGYQLSLTGLNFYGKKGHTSIHARSGYGVLIKDCDFNGAHHHGPGTGYGGVGTVVTQCKLGEDQIIDSHSGQPYATLFDAIDGGVFYNLGGPLPGLPHHGKYLVFWNFNYRSDRDFHYDFWSVEKRRNYTIADPIFVGFRANRTITFENVGIDQSRGEEVFPKSLFEAQLELRLRSGN
ncbi:hypothetical protein J2X69_002578 [Algoriphagus sp. 4150]|uniref:DUF4955 domain-containing protein n=1 Tax=Algoriphagus sp. 4150 TaxID=2817756 RepID=UPI00285D4D8B|nr:DUF4955 domain-containing protein [Algoriphagus sp. 4150]MDR7130230.1 hypothetical protein [Algoriphagus sp. 4150]